MQTQMTTLLEAPSTLSFAERLDALHEMLYTRGGIRPVNAAIEELAKIVLLQLKHAHDPDWAPHGEPPLRETLDPERLRAGGDPGTVKRAFSAMIALPEFAARVPGDDLQPIWPLDEPFRLERVDVLEAALSIIEPEMIRELEYRHDYDLLGTAFDVLLRGRYDHSGGLATYLTPHSVATTLAQLCLADLDVSPDWEPGQPCFGDPCCGTGRFLVAGLREARRIANEFDSDERAARYLDAFTASGLLAADQSPSAVAKARLNLLLFGVAHPRVFTVDDSITDPHLSLARGRMRLILTNPPFGEGKYDSPEGIASTHRLLPSTGKNGAIDPALAFVARCLDLLGDGGVLGIILPDGLVDGATLRRALLASDSETRLRDVSIQANISLPTATFALAGTVARTSAVVLRKGAGRRDFVFLAKAEHVGYLKQSGSAVVDPAGDDLPAIAALGCKLWTGQRTPNFAGGPETLSARPQVTLAPLAGLDTVDPSRVDPSAHAARSERSARGGTILGY
jgi:N-6 DNA Methylase